MTKVKHITAQIEQLCPLTYAEDFDNVGLLVGDYEQEVKEFWLPLIAWKQP